jgi:hypothetical protein
MACLPSESRMREFERRSPGRRRRARGRLSPGSPFRQMANLVFGSDSNRVQRSHEHPLLGEDKGKTLSIVEE